MRVKNPTWDGRPITAAERERAYAEEDADRAAAEKHWEWEREQERKRLPDWAKAQDRMKASATKRNSLLGRLFGSKTTYRRTRGAGTAARGSSAKAAAREAKGFESERLERKLSDTDLQRKLRAHYAKGGNLREFLAANPGAKGGVYTVSMRQAQAISTGYGLYAHLTSARRLAGKEGSTFIAEVVDSQRKKVGYLVPRAGFGVNELREVIEKYPGLSNTNPARKGSLGYAGPDSLAHVFSFAHSVEEAQKIADAANRSGTTRRGKFTAGSFEVKDIPGRLPAVVGRLTGNPGNPSVGGVEFTLRSDGSVAWASDWIKLSTWAAKKQHGFTAKSYGPGTYGHTEVFYKPGKANPAEAAARVYEEFHGAPSTEVVTVTKQAHFHKHLASLGRLELLVVKGTDGYEHKISDFKGAKLCTNEAKNQLFIEGGDQRVAASDWGFESWPHEKNSLGEVTEIRYFTTKHHLGDEGGTAIYFHKSGTTNVNGRHKKVGYGPDLIYRTRDKALEFSGGTYEIKAEGIDK